MKAEDIIAEIRNTREKQAAESGFDPKRIGSRMRARQKDRAAKGGKYVSFVRNSAVVREEPPKS